MIRFFLGLPGRMWGYVAVTAAALAVFLAHSARQRALGRKQAEGDAMQDAFNQVEEGRDAVQDMHGDDRDERIKRLRDNADDW